MQATTLTFGKAVRAGGIAGLLAAGLNNIWSLLAQAMGSVPPPGFPFAVTVSSIFPLLVGAMLYFMLVRFFPKGALLYTAVAVLFLLLSLYPTLYYARLDNMPPTKGFTLLTLPMHLIAGGLGIWGIPKFSR
ncbi:hypothetical protein SAMN04488109_6292 [Chryseolinea serpens]|uniref:Uncharacterized protein n=1 Tax=Chryseolinea serpens TaxID=947013 RepID=A0A1M5XAM5_9BACT|nr:DUF6069 family protein [Chryseolinea serpens]SHH96598.1 hypothetical protein SAMN04488109_6292 [Chryseolinea serpens]